MHIYHQFETARDLLDCNPAVVVYIPPGATAENCASLCVWWVPGTHNE